MVPIPVHKQATGETLPVINTIENTRENVDKVVCV